MFRSIRFSPDNGLFGDQYVIQHFQREFMPGLEFITGDIVEQARAELLGGGTLGKVGIQVHRTARGLT